MTLKTTPKIKINDLVKIYKQGSIEVIALRGLNAEFHPGETVIIEGPSGCGKTTLVNIIGGLDRQSAGDVLIADSKKINSSFLNITKLSNRDLELFRRKRIGIVFQFMNLIPTLTAEENVALPLLLEGISRKERKTKAKKLLELVKIADRADHKPGELSGGEQQRVAVAAALIHDPDIIIADEPTGNLDSETREEILNLFDSLMKEYPEKCLIIVTHDQAVERIADRILSIEDGVITNERESSISTDTEEQKKSNFKEEWYKKKIQELRQQITVIYKNVQDLPS